MQTVLHPHWKVHLSVSESPSPHSSPLLQDLGYVVLSLHELVQESMCHVTLDHGGVQGRHTSLGSGLSICPSEKQKSAFRSHSSAFQACLTNLCLVWQVPAQLHQLFGIPSWLHQLPPYILSSAYMAGFSTTPGYMAESPYFMAPSSWLPSQKSISSSPLLQAAWLNLSQFTQSTLILKADQELPT